MVTALLKKVFGTQNDRELKKLTPMVAVINAFEPKMKALTDAQLAALTPQFKERLGRGEPLDSLLPEAFATVREASIRTLGMRPFDVQMVGGMVLHQGRIAEMKTGEGKTLVATLPIYLNALEGKGVHVVTVNDYLAKRDSAWMGKIYQFLGMSVGVIVHGLNDQERQENYGCDITYGTNNEYGFDYLRDNMKFSLSQYVQRNLHYALIDEVDSILVDEARTPLIISGPAEESTDKYARINAIVPQLKKDPDFKIDEKSRTIVLTEDGVAHAEKLLGIENLYEARNIEILHHVNQGLRAHQLFKRDVDYVVKDNQVIIVDEFTGRLMPGRRWSDGLHQAIEAKEKVKIENENQTLATITFQNYFRMFKKLAGMTGTADTEAAEFHKIYNLDVVVVPTHRAMVRKDEPDLIYKNEAAKFRAVINEIETRHKRGQPVLVGTITIDKSELLSQMLSRRGIEHHVLNAKHHEKEAEIVAQAGRFGSVTIATNMAGRGTDIVLGGNPEYLTKNSLGQNHSPEELQKKLPEFKKQCEAEHGKVVEQGGLHILGTERHESRRIDNQLRGRSGRQGDPGSSQFFISLEDDLMRIFGSDRISRIMDRLKMDENEPIFHPWISKAIENAQKKVEAHNFEIRKNLLDFDSVMNQQRQTVYTFRREVLDGKNLKDKFLDMLDSLAAQISGEFAVHGNQEFNTEGFRDRVYKYFGVRPQENVLAELDKNEDALGQYIYDQALALFEQKEKQYGAAVMDQVLTVFMLQTIDSLWKDHLLSMDHLREGIGLRGYAQKDPILEYKKEGFERFQMMMLRLYEDVAEKVFHVQIQTESGEELAMPTRRAQPMQLQHSANAPATSQRSAGLPPGGGENKKVSEQPSREYPKVGRNDPCPCGSGKKYKKCHGSS